MVFAYALTGLQLPSDEMVVGILHIAHSDHRHLLFDIMAEARASNDIVVDMGDVGAKEQAAIEQILDGKAGAEGERLTPQGTDIGDAYMIVDLSKIVGDIGIACLEPAATGGEIKVVLGIELQLGLIGEIMCVMKIHIAPQVGLQLIGEMIVVPAQTGLEREIANSDVDGVCQNLVLVVSHTVFTVALIIDVNVVVTEIIGDGGPRETQGAGMEDEVATGQQAFAQA